VKKFFTHNLPYTTESGVVIPKLEIAFHTYGKFDPAKNNVVWVFHALTANSDAADWWSGLIGEGKYFNPEEHFIVCANILGSCYGSSGPLTTDPSDGKPFYSRFPSVTIRDMVHAHRLLKNYLGIRKIKYGIGGSMGGYQLLEWSVIEPGLFENMILLATAARESAWGIAIHTTQRLAIETDPTWKNEAADAGRKGLITARGIGMLTYRNYESFVNAQTDDDHRVDDFKASSYIHYQGDKLGKRFNAYSYWLLTKAMDSHHLGRDRGKTEDVLASIHCKTHLIGISSDMLCPVAEQEFLARHIPGATLTIINSSYGHDGFLIEYDKILTSIREYAV
jgi:homoserine O-acetyltransferase/O-succinyltransferase